jgi:hypothetical protein
MAVAIGLAENGKREGGRFKRGSVPHDGRASSNAWAKAIREAGVVLDHAPELADQPLQRPQRPLAVGNYLRTAQIIRCQVVGV